MALGVSSGVMRSRCALTPRPARGRSPARAAAWRRSRRACSRPRPPRRPGRRRCRARVAGRARQGVERAPHGACERCALKARKRVDVGLHRGAVGTRVDRPRARVLVDLVGVDADDGLLARSRPAAGRRSADSPIMRCTRPGSTALVHAARGVDELHHALDLGLHLVGQRLDVVAAAQRVDDVGQLGLLAQDVLRRHGDARAVLARASTSASS